MDNPHWMSVKEIVLLLCEEEYGLKTFRCSEPVFVGDRSLGHAKEIQATDVIPIPGNAKVVMIVSENGIYQYSFEDPSDLSL